MKKNQIIFFESVGFGWVINDKMIRDLGLYEHKDKLLSDSPTDHLPLGTIGFRVSR